MRKMEMFNLTPVQEFYKDKTIFITGATGFIGNAVIEKLLRSCPGIKRIYALIRPKNGVDTAKRFTETFNTIYFELLKKVKPDFQDLISIVNGDIIEDNLGLSEEDIKTLTNEVNIVIHIAATVRFDEKIRIATKLNMVAVKNILDLTRTFKNLKSFVQVSTAFSECYKHESKEEFFKPLRDPFEFIEYVEKTSDELLEKETPNIICGYPNTYTYTKGLAEDIVRREGKDFPLTIVRPSIVMGSWAEPFPGWVDNLSGPFGLMAGVGFGVVRTVHGDESKRVDCIPVDMTANAIIAAGYSITLRNKTDPIKIYNVATGVSNPVTWRELYMWCFNLGLAYPSVKSLWSPLLIPIKCPYTYKIYKFFLHTVPGYTLDFILKIMGKKQMFVKIYDKVNKAQALLSYFTTNEWTFNDDNTRKLISSLDIRDQQIFNFDVTQIQWDLYFLYNIRVLRTNLMKDPLNTVQLGIKKEMRFRIINHIVLILLLFLFYYLFCAIF